MPGRRAAPPLQVWQRRLDHWGERHMMRRAVLKSQAVRRRLRQRRPPRRPRRQRATPEAEAVRRAAKEGRSARTRADLRWFCDVGSGGSNGSGRSGVGLGDA